MYMEVVCRLTNEQLHTAYYEIDRIRNGDGILTSGVVSECIQHIREKYQVNLSATQMATDILFELATRKVTPAALSDDEIEIIESFDYQAINNGVSGAYHNHMYRKLGTFVSILSRRNSPLDQKVISIFSDTFAAEADKLLMEPLKNFNLPEVKEHLEEAERIIEKSSAEYQKIASAFMSSYNLKDYSTQFRAAWQANNRT